MDMEKEKETYNRGEMVIMKLEHLIQAYKLNNIDTELKDMSNENERAGVITFNEEMSASYLLDNEDIVIAMKIFLNPLPQAQPPHTPPAPNISSIELINHTTKIINIIQNTIMLLANIPQKECNMILDKLGMFDNTFKEGKQIRHLEHSYRMEIVQGLICFSINENIENN